jgi:preprotein translocase subunit SecY
MLVLYRIGTFIPTPGVDASELARFWQQQGGGVFDLMNMFTGGALRNFGLFSLGIMPYINASIILQLLTVVIPTLEKLAKEGEAGRRVITQYTRYLTVVLGVVQATGLAIFMANFPDAQVIPDPSWTFYVHAVLALTAGTTLLMWVGEQITERGLGNGISLLIFAGIVAEFPGTFGQIFSLVRLGTFPVGKVVLLLGLSVAIMAFTVIVTLGTRKVPIQYARRVQGRHVVGGAAQYLPLRVNAAGVIPVIFAQALMTLPQMGAGALGVNVDPTSWWAGFLGAFVDYTSGVYLTLFSTLIIFFSFFYTAVIINPQELAENLKKHGGFIPGIRPGQATAEYIEKTMTRITWAGSFFLAAICVVPILLARALDLPPALSASALIGGTGLMIIVGVALDTLRQVESHLLMRHYDGFLGPRGARLRGRR